MKPSFAIIAGIGKERFVKSQIYAKAAPACQKPAQAAAAPQTVQVATATPQAPARTTDASLRYTHNGVTWTRPDVYSSWTRE